MLLNTLACAFILAASCLGNVVVHLDFMNAHIALVSVPDSLLNQDATLVLTFVLPNAHHTMAHIIILPIFHFTVPLSNGHT
jgi:hypothetical protein